MNESVPAKPPMLSAHLLNCSKINDDPTKKIQRHIVNIDTLFIPNQLKLLKSTNSS